MPHRVRSSPPCHFRVRGSATGAPAECRKTMARWKAGRLALVAAQPPHQNGEEDRWVRLIAPSINSYCTALDYKYANVLCVIFFHRSPDVVQCLRTCLCQASTSVHFCSTCNDHQTSCLLCPNRSRSVHESPGVPVPLDSLGLVVRFDRTGSRAATKAATMTRMGRRARETNPAGHEHEYFVPASNCPPRYLTSTHIFILCSGLMNAYYRISGIYFRLSYCMFTLVRSCCTHSSLSRPSLSRPCSALPLLHALSIRFFPDSTFRFHLFLPLPSV